jgi:RNA polymerase sigma factor (sigma-70 family)
VARLSDFDQEVFHLICRQGFSIEDCVVVMQQNFAEVSAEQIDASVQRLRNTLSPHQLWLLNTRRTRTTSLSADEEGSLTPVREIQDTAPDPETRTALQESADGLHRALARLCNSDRLLLQLRFEQEMTLAEVAKMFSLKDAQTADRRIRDALARVRELLGVEAEVAGNAAAKSV